VVGDGVDGVHGGGWTENRDDRKKIVAQSYFLFSRFWTRNHVRSLTFEMARRVTKRSLRLASSDRDPHQRFAKNHAKSLLFFGLPNGALGFFLFFFSRSTAENMAHCFEIFSLVEKIRCNWDPHHYSSYTKETKNKRPVVAGLLSKG
jgi:hypothetical protein